MKINRINYLNTTVSGRSMIEMLGVLAIIGVLSIGALNGFRYAMDKHKANTILYDISLGFSTMQTLEYAGDDVNLGFTPESGLTMEGYRDDAGYDYVEVSNVPKSVCEKLLDFKGVGNIEGIYDTNLAELTECSEGQVMLFKNNNISGERIGDEPDVEECTSGTYNETAGKCCDEVTAGVCQTVTEATSGVCPSITTAQDGTECTTASNEAGTCLSGVCEKKYDGVECTSNEQCGGTGSGYFCAFDNPTDCGDDDKGTGKCALVSRYSYDETTDGDWRLTSSKMNWWNAQNWCYAQSGFSPATREDVECTGGTGYAGCLTTSTIVRGYNSSEGAYVTTYTDASGNTQTRLFVQEGEAFTSSKYTWLDDYGNSCYAYAVRLLSGTVSYFNRTNFNYPALCVRR